MQKIKLFAINGTDIKIELTKCDVGCPAFFSSCEHGDICNLFDPYDIVEDTVNGFPYFCKLPEKERS